VVTVAGPGLALWAHAEVNKARMTLKTRILIVAQIDTEEPLFV
jgi:hypothetical protein